MHLVNALKNNYYRMEWQTNFNDDVMSDQAAIKWYLMD